MIDCYRYILRRTIEYWLFYCTRILVKMQKRVHFTGVIICIMKQLTIYECLHTIGNTLKVLLNISKEIPSNLFLKSCRLKISS